MLYYVLAVVNVILFAGANLRYGKRNLTAVKKGTLTIEKFTLYAMIAMYIFIFTFESIYSNSDMQGYRDAYLSFQYLNKSFTSIIGNKDPFYYILNYFFYKLGFGFYWWHALIGIFYSFALYNLIKHYSSNVYISFIVSISLGSFGFMLSALRQILAISVIMFAFKYLEEKRVFKFIVLTLFASLFHSTAIVFLLAYPLYRIKLKVKTLIVMVIGMVVMIPLARPAIVFLLPRIGAHEMYYEYLTSDTTLSISGTIISASILLFCVIFLLQNKKASKYQGLCNFAVVSLFFRLLSNVFFAEMFRLSLYFSIFDIIMITEACSCGDKKDKTLIKIKTLVATSALVVYYIMSPHSNITSYLFNF